MLMNVHYLKIECRINVSAEDISFWEENQVSPTLSIDSMRDILHIFVNGQLIGIWSLSLSLSVLFQVCGYGYGYDPDQALLMILFFLLNSNPILT